MYRRAFFDVRAFGELVHAWHVTFRPATILEVGCGEGQVTEALAHQFRDATIVGIDIDPRVGRLYAGPRERVTFLCAGIEDVDQRFDLIVVCDVLHHLRREERSAFCASIARRTNRSLIVKEWERRRSLIHLACHASDRYITQDQVQYCTRAELHELIATAGVGPIIAEQRIGPWVNNLVLMARRV